MWNVWCVVVVVVVFVVECVSALSTVELSLGQKRMSRVLHPSLKRNNCHCLHASSAFSRSAAG